MPKVADASADTDDLDVDELEEKAADLSDQIDHLKERRSSAREALEATSDPDEQVELRMEVQAIEDTIGALQDERRGVQEKLEEARRQAQREKAVGELASIAGEAEEARQAFHDAQDALMEAIEEHATDLEEAREAWQGAHERFKRKLLGVAPGAYEPRTRHKSDREERLEEAEQIMAELRELGAPIGAALPHAFIDAHQWTGLARGEAQPHVPERHQGEGSHILEAVLDAAPLEA